MTMSDFSCGDYTTLHEFLRDIERLLFVPNFQKMQINLI